jgi:hypothetical protein
VEIYDQISAIALYYWEAICRSAAMAKDWIVRWSIIPGLLLALCIAVVEFPPPSWTALGGLATMVQVRKHAYRLFLGFLLFLTIMVGFAFIEDAPNQMRIRDQKIIQLGGAPDAPIAVPRRLPGSNEKRVLAAVGELSEIMNKDVQDACDRAKVALACIQQIRTVQPSDCAAKTDAAFQKGRTILNKLWTSADAGFLNAGDRQILEILNQAVQPKDRQIFIDFDQYALGTYNRMYFLSLIENDPNERRRLFEPALNLSIASNRWEEATERYCNFVGKTNDRISEIRRQISQ